MFPLAIKDYMHGGGQANHSTSAYQSSLLSHRRRFPFSRFKQTVSNHNDRYHINLIFLLLFPHVCLLSRIIRTISFDPDLERVEMEKRPVVYVRGDIRNRHGDVLVNAANAELIAGQFPFSCY